MAYGQRVKCENCGSVFFESYLIRKGDDEKCPICKKTEYLIDMDGE